MLYDRLIYITVGTSRKATTWTRQELLWSELCAKLSAPMRSTETLIEYMAMAKSQQDELKDIGGYVGGTLDGDRRKATAVTGRDIITLDLDSIPAGGTADVLRRIDSLGCSYCVYSTRKHCEAAPRLRVLLLLNRTVTADEYEPIGRKIAELVGMELCDPSTFEASRLMYWPSCSADSTYIYTYTDKPLADADGILQMYADWHDVKQWSGVSAPKMPRGAKQADPTAKEGIVGAFCRTYDVPRVLDELLGDVYLPCGDGRYTYAGGSTTGGAVVYNDGAFLYSHHATDPAGGKLCNAFDLVRLHLYSCLDAEAKPDTPTNKLPSFAAMCQFCNEETEVSNRLKIEKYGSAVTVFSEAPPTDYDPNWATQLVTDAQGKFLKHIENYKLVLRNLPELKGLIRLNLFSGRIEGFPGLPWERGGRHLWNDNDTTQLQSFLERSNFGKSARQDITNVIGAVAEEQAYHPVRVYLGSLVWDGIPRLDALLIDYLGAADTSYTRTVTRKAFVAAVARVMHPGIKYDTMPVLVGAQGRHKSTLLAKMGGAWFSDSLRSFEGKDAMETIAGTWVNEVAEMQAMEKSEINSAKAFLSKTSDYYRPAYGHFAEEQRRQCVFFGTTNSADFIRDMTGGRRFWPVDIDVQERAKNVFTDLDGERDQLWAEAVERWKSGETLHLSAEAEKEAVEEQQSHTEQHPWEAIIYDFIERPVPADWLKRPLDVRRMYWDSCSRGQAPGAVVERDRISAREIWCEALGRDLGTIKQADARLINSILAKAPGWRKCTKSKRFGIDYDQKGPRVEGYIRCPAGKH